MLNKPYFIVKYKILAVLICVMVFMTGCLGEHDLAVERAAKAKKAKGDIIIGVAWPFSKRNDLIWEGIQLATQELNEAGGVMSRKIRLIRQDDEGLTTRGMTIAQDFADNLDMVAVIGHGNSFVSVPAAAIYEKTGVLMLTPGSTSPKLTQMGYKRIFRSIPSDTEIGSQMAQFVAKKGCRRMVVVYADNEYGRGLANSFEDQAQEEGISIVDRCTNISDYETFKRTLDKWRIFNFDGVFVADTVPEGAEFIRRLREEGVTVPIISGDGLDLPEFLEVCREAAEGTVVASIFNPYDKRPKVGKFIQAFTEEYDSMPDAWAAQGYDAVMLLAHAMELSSSTVPDEIASALRTTSIWPGVTGFHTFDEMGDVSDKLVIKKVVQEGKFDYLLE